MRRLVVVIAPLVASLVACGKSQNKPPPPEVQAMTPTDAAAPGAADAATPSSKGAGFVIHRAGDGFGREPTTDDPDGAWPAFLASTPLGDPIVADADIEAVGLAPLRLVLTGAAGARFSGDARRSVGESRFIATLDGVRLYAGRVMFIATARALHHPVVHVMHDGASVSIWIVPRIGDHKASDLVATPAVLEHFRRTGRLVESGDPQARFATRRWIAEAAAGKPGAPATRITAECARDACTLSFAFRQTGTDTWDDRGKKPIDVAEFDAVWAEIARGGLMQMIPKDTASGVIHPPTLRYAVHAEREDGTGVDVDRSWVSGALDDKQGSRFLDAAVGLARKHGFDPRYFRTPD